MRQIDDRVRLCRRAVSLEFGRGPARELALAFLRGILEEVRFALKLPLEEARFEPVWGFCCQAVGLVYCQSSTLPGKPFSVPSPAIRFAERAEGVKGPKR